MKPNPLHETLELCRPGSNDHLLPELAPLAEELNRDEKLRLRWERVQAHDARIAFLCHDLEVPAGLAEQLLAGLAAAQPASGPANAVGSGWQAAVEQATRETGAAPCEANAPVPAAAGIKNFQRRWFVGAGLAAAALAALFVWRPWAAAVVLSGEEILANAPAWLSPLLESDAWRTDFESAPSDTYAPCTSVVGELRGWQYQGVPIDPRAIAYWLAPLGNGRPHDLQAQGVLLVAQRPGELEDLPSLPPLSPAWSTGRQSVGVWQRGPLVYVLLVEGEPHWYRRFLKDTPIAGKLNRPLEDFAG